MLIFVLALHALKCRRDRLRGLIGQPQTIEGLLAVQRMTDAQADDDLALSVRVSRIYDAVDVLAVAKRLYDRKLPLNSRIRLTVLPHAQTEAEFLRKAGQIRHSPTRTLALLHLLRRRTIILYITKREEVSECPCYYITAALIIAAVFAHLSDARDNIACKTRLLRNYEYHFGSSLPSFSSEYCMTTLT